MCQRSTHARSEADSVQVAAEPFELDRVALVDGKAIGCEAQILHHVNNRAGVPQRERQTRQTTETTSTWDCEQQET